MCRYSKVIRLSRESGNPGTQGLKRLLLNLSLAGVTVTNCKHEISCRVCLYVFSLAPRLRGEGRGEGCPASNAGKSTSERCPSPGIRAFAQMPTSPRKRGE